ncbi:biotin/lipoyl attachment domain-containing protein [Oscillochloris trichoides DG-6]|uniref:Biotin/lipoyl attachment domain-containing protein n=1 Tax=Oscillochloris trichoides DG-6 TaxID=765420 RepID=E1IB02_9CHLR|nr:acetyl-CoA carboxylase biotin carboxyl carrier protein subunit [Oscillochloris trichoides]EFO81648.1 biotin/lipoyl attachment domain-containing protein [Oscillochloris trichoides DG-6]
MRKLLVTIDGTEFQVQVPEVPDSDGFFTVMVNGQPMRTALSSLADSEVLEWAMVNSRPYELQIDHELRWIQSRHGRHNVQVRDQDSRISHPRSTDGRIKAPIPGVVVRVLVDVGQEVELDQPLLVLEAMKMENEIRATRAGRIASLNATPGRAVQLGTLLAEIV